MSIVTKYIPPCTIKITYNINHECVGYITAVPMIGHLYIEVDIKHRNQGIGTKLLKKYIDIMFLNKRDVILTTSSDNNFMIKILDKLKFELVDVDEESAIGDLIYRLVYSK